MKKLLVLLSLLILTVSAFAQIKTGTIKGKVIDEDKNTPIGYATVALYKNGNDKMLGGSVTDISGNFSFDKLDNGAYLLKIFFVGYEPVEKNVTITEERKIISMPIKLKVLVEDLKGVEVVEMASQMKLDVDKKVFQVDQNIANTGGSASEVLSTIPSVEVDNEGEISLRGSTNVTVWINGKASGLSADNRAQILEQLPAESIDRIEVITNPSAKFSPEGTSGIINIILKQDRKAGYYGSVQAGIDSKLGYNASANINFNKGKFEAYANAGIRRRVFNGKEYTYRSNLDSNNDTVSFLNQDAVSGGDNLGFFGRAGVTYKPTKKDNVYLDVFGMYGFGGRNNTNTYESDMPYMYSSSNRIATSNDNMLGGNVMLSYRHEFNPKSTLDLSAAYNSWNMNGNSEYTQHSNFSNDIYYDSYQKQVNNFGNNSIELQADYVNTFKNNTKLEAGYKGSIFSENSPVETFSGTDAENASLDSLLYNNFIYKSNIQALYGTFSGKVNSFGYSIGLRGEYTGIKTKSLSVDEIDFEDAIPYYSKPYYNLFPSVFLSYALPKGHEIQVNYTKRISRPRGMQINSFINITDSANISFGNPELAPEFSHALELNYIKSWQHHTISFSGWYRYVENKIQRIRWREDKVMKSTFDNVTSGQSAGIEVVVKNEFFKMLNLTSSVNVFYNQLSGFTYQIAGADDVIVGFSSSGVSWNARLVANLILPHSMSLQITGRYNSSQIVAQGSQKANYSLDAAFRKSFLHRALNVSINARDILNSRKMTSFTSGDGFYQEYFNQRMGRVFSLNVTYSFGNTRADRNAKKPRMQQESSSGYEDVE